MDGFNWALTFLGGGSLLALVSLYTAVVNRRNVKSEAQARDLKSPAELDQIMATTRSIEVQTVLNVNAALVKENDGLRERLDEIDEWKGGWEKELRELRLTLSAVQRGLAAAHSYITSLLQIIERYAPHVTIPDYPEGYVRPDALAWKKDH